MLTPAAWLKRRNAVTRELARAQASTHKHKDRDVTALTLYVAWLTKMSLESGKTVQPVRHPAIL